jgi:hypothetical protein
MTPTIEHKDRTRRPPLFADPPAPQRRVEAWTTLYVRRIVAVPPSRATIRLATMLAGGGAVIEGRRARLVAAPLRSNGGALARTVGVLRGPWGWSVPVELELLRWSDRRIELGVRPRCGRFRLHNRERYFAASHAVLDAIAERLV